MGAIKLVLAYDGTPFAGWAAQPGKRPVQRELERALATVLRIEVRLTVAGRTDTGVHALGQVVSYDGPLPSLRSVNAVLPDEIAVVSAEEAPEGFSARHDARSRTCASRSSTTSASRRPRPRPRPSSRSSRS